MYRAKCRPRGRSILIPNARELIDGYLDDALTADQQAELSAWIKANPENARIFAEAMLLHDRLRNTLGTAETPDAILPSLIIESPRGWLGGSWLLSSLARSTAAAVLLTT